ncbi:MAG TPA: NAD(P)H-hydrate epimerase [Cytophagales bacterium]|nr:NAD(P)H-hydrate epimerase [Cytophagales bacterium]
MPFPTYPLSSLPLLTKSQMIEVDRLMIEEYHIGLIQMMENAGRGLARLAMDFLQGEPIARGYVLVLSGSGGNGGGAMVAARRLAGWGIPVKLLLSADSNRLGEVPRHQLRILKAMEVPVLTEWPEVLPSLILDGMIGYSLTGAPRGRALDYILQANGLVQIPTVSLDAPSGLNVTNGSVPGEAIRAKATLTLALPKVGLTIPDAQAYVGQLYLADISVPRKIYQQMGLPTLPDSLFQEGDIVALDEATMD